MKTLTLIAILFASSSFAQIKTDKVAHFGIGYVAGSLTTGTTLALGNGKGEWWKSVTVSFATGAILGTGKEIKDYMTYGVFDWGDWGSTIIGAVVGGVTIKLNLKWYEKKHLI